MTKILTEAGFGDYQKKGYAWIAAEHTAAADERRTRCLRTDSTAWRPSRPSRAASGRAKREVCTGETT